METKEELLKIYSAYFPYELKVKHSDYEREIDSICDIVSLCKEEIEIMNSEHGYVCDFGYIKPVLYSMDMLTKEIEHKGERFIPIEKINEHSDYSLLMEDSELPDDVYWVDKCNLNMLSIYEIYNLHQKLLEWHFNVFGLDENEYIKKESLK